MRFYIWHLMAFSLIFSTYATNAKFEHEVQGGKWHKGGNLVISHKDPEDGTFELKIDIDLTPKGLMGRVLTKVVNPQYIFNFPEAMLAEQGYSDLADSGPIDLAHDDKVATVKSLGQVDIHGYEGAHKVEVRSKSTVSENYPDGKWHMHLYYHPDVPSVGIFKSEIFYHGIAGDYDIVSLEK